METDQIHARWNKGKLVGQKPPLKPKDIWAIRFHLQNTHHVRDLAIFNLAIDSKLRGCDLVSLRVRDVKHADQVGCLRMARNGESKGGELSVPQSPAKSPHISTRQYARIVPQWTAAIGLDSTVYGTHSMRRTKATPIYQADQESSDRPVPAWPHQAGKHREIPWDRGR